MVSGKNKEKLRDLRGVSGKENSAIIPFLKGAKSVEDKVAFLESVKENFSLSYDDKCLAENILRKYRGKEYGIDDDSLVKEFDLYPEKIAPGYVMREKPKGDSDWASHNDRIEPGTGRYVYAGSDVFGNVYDGKISKVFDNFKKLPLEAISKLKGKVYACQSGCRDSGISSAYYMKDLTLADKVGLLVKCNRIEDARTMLRDIGANKPQEGDFYPSDWDSFIRDQQKLKEDEYKMEIKHRSYWNKRKPNFSPGLKDYLSRDQQIQNGTYQSSEATYQPNNSFNNIRSQRNKTSQKVGVTMAVAGLGVSILLIGSNLTGNVIGTLSTDTTNLVGVGAFLVGIVGAMLCLKKK